MTRDEAHLDFDGPLVDQNHLWNGGFAAPVLAASRSSGMMPAAHHAEQAGAKVPAWHGVERGVDGLVGELYRVGHTCQCALNLRRTQALAKRIDHHAPERVAGDQLAQASRLVGQQTSAPVGSHTAITSGNPGSASRGHFSIRLPAVAPYLAGDGGTGSHQS